MAVKTIASRGGDFVLHLESTANNYMSGTIENDTGSIQNLADVVGYPLKVGSGTGKYKLALESDDTADVIAFIVSGRPIVDLPATSGETAFASPYTVIDKGPGVINSTKLPSNDATDVAFSTVVLSTAAAAIDLKLVAEPTKSTTQSA